jgi:hypothetical protein
MRVVASAITVVLLVAGPAAPARAHSSGPARVTVAMVAGPVAPATVQASPRMPYTVYWDFNEEEDFLRVPSGRTGQLIPPWDPNGQLCVVPDHSGRFVVGYNPTLASQHNPGSLKPVKEPPVGEAMYDRHGRFIKTVFVPGPFPLPGTTTGGDIPPDAAGGGAFNNNGTMTGCTFDNERNLFASDLGTAQGAFPPPDDGRLIEWFAPRYDSFCIIDGPIAGGVGPHHVDGTGGLRQPGDLATDPNNGDLLLPEAGSPTGGIGGRILRFAQASLPRSAADCSPDGLYPAARLRVSTFVQGTVSYLPFPVAIARDPVCHCWAISTVIGDPSVVWVHDDGTPVAGRSLPGVDIAHLGQDPNAANPFGIAFAPDGTLYLVDIHIVCSAPLVNCGPAAKAGRVLRVTFNNGRPNPTQTVASGLDFPTSATVCVRGRDNICPGAPPQGADSG